MLVAALHTRHQHSFCALQGLPPGCASLPGSVSAILHQSRPLVRLKSHPQLSGPVLRSRKIVLSQTGSSVKGNPQTLLDAARAEFAKAGISEEATEHALKQYRTYSKWDLSSKLQPAIQMWVNAIGASELSNRLMRSPRMMVTTPACCNDVFEWLTSLGIDTDRIQHREPKVMTRKLSDVQSTLTAIQQGLQLRDKQLPLFFRRHFYSLIFSAERVIQTLQVVADLLAVPMASSEVQETVMSCDERLFHKSAVHLHQTISFFFTEFGGGQQAAKAALKGGIFRLSKEAVKAHAAELQATLGWTDLELSQQLNQDPKLLCSKPTTIAKNIKELQLYNFTPVQAQHICASQPRLAGVNWTSPSSLDKLDFFVHVLRMTPDDIAARPTSLTYSLVKRVGPRMEFLCQCGLLDPAIPFLHSSHYSKVFDYTDAAFKTCVRAASVRSGLVYDDVFKQHWLQRWHYLRQQVNLSVVEIAAHPALLLASLQDTLRPRWCFLTWLEAEQADFVAMEHLAALAALSDESFALFYSRPGLVFDKQS